MNMSHLLVFLQFVSLGLLFISVGTYSLAYGGVLKLFFMGSAVALFVWVAFYNRIGNFNIVPEIKQGSELITQGPYRFIRHPMYAGVTLIALAEIISLFALWKVPVFILLMVVLYLKASREERLWCAKSDEYRAFQKKTKMFIPFVL